MLRSVSRRRISAPSVSEEIETSRLVHVKETFVLKWGRGTMIVLGTLRHADSNFKSQPEQDIPREPMSRSECRSLERDCDCLIGAQRPLSSRLALVIR